MRSYEEAEKMKNRERGTHQSLVDGGGTTATSVQEKVQSPRNVAGKRCGGGVVDKDVRRRRWPGAGQRRRSFLSVPLAGDEAQGAGKHRRKKALWRGKKNKLAPPLIYTEEAGRGGRGECSTTTTVSAISRHVAARSGAAVPVTVP
jgi:hypothetical protein